MGGWLKFAIALFGSGMLIAEQTNQWILVSNPHFEVYSQIGGEAPQNALAWFERWRSVFLQGGFLPEIARPVNLPILRIIGFRSAQEYQQFRTRSTADAYYAEADHREYIVMPSLDPRFFGTAAHEYAHFALHASGLKVPEWLGEGLAEYFSTAQFTNNACQLGGDLPSRTQILRRKAWMPLTELFDFKLDSAAGKTRRDIEVFYAQSWGLADMLMTSPEYRTRLSEFIAGLNSGASSREALAKIYGKSLETVAQDLTSWFHQKRRTLVVRTTFSEPAAASAVALSDNQFSAVLADLLVVTGNLDRARAQYAEIARNTPRMIQIFTPL